jgi:hypothetical protein
VVKRKSLGSFFDQTQHEPVDKNQLILSGFELFGVVAGLHETVRSPHLISSSPLISPYHPFLLSRLSQQLRSASSALILALQVPSSSHIISRLSQPLPLASPPLILLPQPSPSSRFISPHPLASANRFLLPHLLSSSRFISPAPLGSPPLLRSDLLPSSRRLSHGPPV